MKLLEIEFFLKKLFFIRIGDCRVAASGAGIFDYEGGKLEKEKKRSEADYYFVY